MLNSDAEHVLYETTWLFGVCLKDCLRGLEFRNLTEQICIMTGEFTEKQALRTATVLKYNKNDSPS